MRAKGIQRPMEVETRTLEELKEVGSGWGGAGRGRDSLLSLGVGCYGRAVRAALQLVWPVGGGGQGLVRAEEGRLGAALQSAWAVLQFDLQGGH